MNLGRNLEEVIALIRKHEAFEKSAQAQDERFQALQKLTNYELKEMQRREMDAEEERRRRAGSPPQGRRGETTFPAEGGVRTAPEGRFLVAFVCLSLCSIRSCGAHSLAELLFISLGFPLNFVRDSGVSALSGGPLDITLSSMGSGTLRSTPGITLPISLIFVRLLWFAFCTITALRRCKFRVNAKEASISDDRSSRGVDVCHCDRRLQNVVVTCTRPSRPLGGCRFRGNRGSMHMTCEVSLHVQ